MRFSFLIFTLIISSAIFAQSRKSILKEIMLYQNKEVRKASFSVSKDSLNNALITYFKRNNYIYDTIIEDSLTFHKRLTCHGEKQFLDDGSKDRNIIYRNFYVLAFLEVKNDKTRFPVFKTLLKDEYTSKDEYNQAVLSYGTFAIPVNNKMQYCFYNGKRFQFDKTAIQRFLYFYLYNQPIPLTEELILKINSYNAKQKSEENKIIEGKNY